MGYSPTPQRAAALVMLVATAAALDYELAYSNPTTGICRAPEHGATARCNVTKSSTGELLRLLRVRVGSDPKDAAVAVGRSYDGHDWEGLNPHPGRFECVGGGASCSFAWNASKYTYSLWKVVMTQPGGTRHRTAKLFSQAAFGATLRDIETFDPRGGGDPAAAGAWFDAQVAGNAELLRTRLRQQANPRAYARDTVLFHQCEVGARWHRHAFTDRDVGSLLTVANASHAPSKNYTLSIGGVGYTDIPHALFPAGAGVYNICRAVEPTGSLVVVSRVSDPGPPCTTSTSFRNPAVWFASPPPSVVPVGAGAAFAPVRGVAAPGSAIVTTKAGAGCAAPLDPFARQYVTVNGTLYVFDARLKLLENEESSPSAIATALGQRCPAVAPNYLNEDGCRSDHSPCAAVRCGSHGETANIPARGNHYSLIVSGETARDYRVRRAGEMDASTFAGNLPGPFHNVVVAGSDQLRKRVAWALYQMIPINSIDVPRLQDSECWAVYTDIFVRHALGNYFDILKEVAHSPMMGTFLSFVHSSSYAAKNPPALPDQNFAREIMQLFTIGLWELQKDGTAVLTPDGAQVQTYGVADIISMSRAWTGFNVQGNRGNIEDYNVNMVDPMQITPAARDAFPKTDIQTGYLGDGYPLCNDLPPRHHLRAGAEYVYVGKASAAPQWDRLPANRYHDLNPHGVKIKVLGAPTCVATTQCGQPQSASLAAFRVLIAATTEFPTGAGAPELYLHGSNGHVMKVAKVVSFAHAGTSFVVAPFGDAMNAGNYTSWPAEFARLFPVGTTLRVTNSRTAAAPPTPRAYTPPADSPLHRELCAGKAGGACTFPAKVVLARDVNCTAGDRACMDLEDLRTVRVVDADGETVRYYQHKAPACVRLAFFEGGRMATAKTATSKEYTSQGQCADPRGALAGAVCCYVRPDNTTQHFHKAYAPPQCRVLGERMSYATAGRRCASLGLSLCSDIDKAEAVEYTTACAKEQPSWVARPCRLQVVVRTAGDVNILSPGTMHQPLFLNDTANLNTFAPRWQNGTYPKADGSALPEGCAVQWAGTLPSVACDVDVESAAVFSAVPSKEAAEAALVMGSFDPALYRDAGGKAVYKCHAPCRGDVVVYTTHGKVDATAIVGVRQPAWYGGGYKYYANRVETVWVGRGAGRFAFRNPPNFMPLLGEQQLYLPLQEELAYYGRVAAARETDALLTYLVRHRNTAPFVGSLLIQHHVTSNPSPRYVEAVADAFTSGRYDGRGSGRHGCLTATMAAVLLDREARAATLDADPGYGMTREPLLKLLHAFRALEFETLLGEEVAFSGLSRTIGQDMFGVPSVFGFYLPNYAPNGPVADAGLVSPEATLNVGPYLFGLIDGLRGVSRTGLVRGQFGHSPGVQGKFTYTPSTGSKHLPNATTNSQIIDELDLLLTDGRLSRESKAAVARSMLVWTPTSRNVLACEAHVDFKLQKHCDCAHQASCTAGDTCMKGGAIQPPSGCVRSKATHFQSMDAENPSLFCCSRPDPAAATQHNVQIAQELMLATPEFHTSNLRGADGGVRKPAVPAAPSGKDGYKAVVVVVLEGGADSWNFLIPGAAENCTAPLSFDQYTARRGAVARPRDGLSSITPVNGHKQPCKELYVSDDLSAVAEMFNEGDAAWFSNIGNLYKPTSRDTKATVTLPPHLFAHNVQRQQAESLDCQNTAAKGVLGRMAEGFAEAGGRSNVYSMGVYQKIAEAEKVTAMILDETTGASPLKTHAQFPDAVDALTNFTSRSYFADTYQGTLQSSILSASDLSKRLQKLPAANVTYGADAAGHQFSVVSNVMRLRGDSGKPLADRDFFALSLGGYDTHHALSEASTPLLNAALAKFKEDMKAQGMWEDVVVLVTSDFGRTLNSNGVGTDHAWGGNYFAVGGSIKDRTVLGEYVPSMEDGHTQSWGSGIVIPVWGYELMWGPVAEWVGVPEASLQHVLPNLKNFPPVGMADLFESKATLSQSFGHVLVAPSSSSAGEGLAYERWTGPMFAAAAFAIAVAAAARRRRSGGYEALAADAGKAAPPLPLCGGAPAEGADVQCARV